MAHVLTDLASRTKDADVRALVGLSVTTPTKLAAQLENYAGDPSWRLLGYERAGRIVACIGLEIIRAEEAAIRVLSVAPAQRLQGLGRSLVRDALAHLTLRCVVAETDADSVGFYETCGFDVEAAKPRHGRERFRCSLRIPQAN